MAHARRADRPPKQAGATPAHDREAIFRANAGRPFEEWENDAARVAEALVADVRALDATRLAAAPPWIHEATLADEVIQRFLGGGVRLFDGDGIASLGLEQVRVIEAPSVTASDVRPGRLTGGATRAARAGAPRRAPA